MMLPGWLGVCLFVSPKQPTRARILQAIRDHPGIHKLAIQQATDASWGSVSHHVAVLQRRNLIRCVPVKGKLRIYPASVEERAEAPLAALRHPLASTIVQELQDVPGLQLMELSSRLDESRKRVRRVLESMEEAGLVEGFGNHRRRYELTRPGELNAFETTP